MKKLLLFLFALIFLSNICHCLELGKKKIVKIKYKGYEIDALENIVRVRLSLPINKIKSQANSIFNELKDFEPLLKAEQLYENSKEFRFKKDNFDINEIQRTEEVLSRTIVAEYKSDIDVVSFINYLQQEYPEVEIAEPYIVDELLHYPNDPFISSQRVLQTIQAFDAWEYNQGDSSIVIGISDCGVEQTHQDIWNSLSYNWNEIPDNGIDDDNNGYIDDYFGYNFAHPDDGIGWNNTEYPFNDHGTNVAGIIGATTNNGIGIAGIAYKCKIFPIKVSPPPDQGSVLIIYGYQSIIYAGVRGFSVLNCSWGRQKPFSEIDQSIIDYAIANNVLIVAAGGNSSGATNPIYPAAYRGVLGVGEVDGDDVVTSSSTMGAHIRIMAQGRDNFSTTNQSNYRTLTEGGTSYASPVVAGAAGIVRSKFPQLSPLQAIEFIRQSTDNIANKNYNWREIIPGRVNLLKCVINNPFNIPGFFPLEYKFTNSKGETIERFKAGDTIFLRIKIKNYLGNSNNNIFTLASLDNLNTISILDSVFYKPTSSTNEEFYIGEFKIKLNSQSFDKIIMKMKISSSNNYSDFFLFNFLPSTEVTTFSNNTIKFSASDRGTLGFGGSLSYKDGVGFIYKTYDNALPKAGFLASEDSKKLVSANFGLGPDANDFNNIKPYTEPNRNIGIFNDAIAYSDNRIGINVNQTFVFPSNNSSVVKAIITITNTNNYPINNLSVGHFFDWDVSGYIRRNQVKLFPEAIPPELPANKVAGEIIFYNNKYPVYGCAVYSEEAEAIPQSAGIPSKSYYTFDELKQYLNSGTSIQYTSIGDCALVIGMKFPGEIPSGASKTYTLCFGAGDNTEHLALELKNCLLGISTVKDNNYENNLELEVYPNPNSGVFYVNIYNLECCAELKLYNMFGDLVFSDQIKTNNTKFQYDVSKLPTGIYFLEIKTSKLIKYKKITIIN